MNKILPFLFVFIGFSVSAQVICDPKCSPDCCTLNPSASGGAAPYTYLWGDGETTPTIDACETGTYTVVVTDASGICTVDTSFNVEINEPATLICRYRFLDPTDPWTSDCVISICESNTRRLQIDVNPLADDNNCTAQSPTGVAYTASPSGILELGPSQIEDGDWIYTCTDRNGCEVMAVITMNIIPSPVATCSSMPSNCGMTDGIAFVNETFVSYQWDAAAGSQTTQTATGLSAGTYTVIVTDANGCTAECTVEVLDEDDLTVSCTGTNVLCFGQNSGSATATPSGGTAPYAYLWDDPAGQTTATATNLIAGTYIVVITDANGCEATCSYTVIEPGQLLLNPTCT